MNFDLPIVLTTLVFVTGLIWAVDAYVFAPSREKHEKMHAIAELARGYFPVFLLVLVIRSFGFEAYRIPSQSLEPTLTVGDFVLVNKYQYGLRLPVLDIKVISVSEPERGDIMVLRYPPDPKKYYIKRVIGLPGDRVSYENKRLIINGKPVATDFVSDTVMRDMDSQSVSVREYQENLKGHPHRIYTRPSMTMQKKIEVVVPEGLYFVMGDNRDDSHDSRYFGFVPEKNIVGKATRVLFSWNKSESITRKFRNDRNFKKIV